MDDDTFKAAVLEFQERAMARLDALDARFEAIETRFKAVEGRLDAIVARLDEQDQVLDRLIGKVDRLQGMALTAVTAAEQALTSVTSLGRRVGRLENPDG